MASNQAIRTGCRSSRALPGRLGLGTSGDAGSDSYYLCMSGNSDESSANKDEGEWGIIVEKKRSIGQRLRGLGKIADNDKMVKTLEEILCAEPAIGRVHRED